MSSNHSAPRYPQYTNSVLRFAGRARLSVLAAILAVSGLFAANAQAYDVEQ